MSHAASRHESPEARECIRRCQQCHDAGLESVLSCLETGGAHASAAHIALLLDCPQACQRLGDDQQLQACARTCVRCAGACGAVAAQG